MVRLTPILPVELSAEQRTLYDDIQAQIGRSEGFHAFLTSRGDGALIGPFNAWLHTSRAGRAMLNLTEALAAEATLPEPCR